MKHLKTPLIILFMFAFNAVNAAEQLKNKIEFNMPDKFTDFSTDVNRNTKDRENLIRQLTELMTDSIAKYSKNTFEIMVNDIDMVGQFLLSNTEFIRVVNEYDRTRFEFSYKMFDSAGKVLKQGDVNLSDRNPLNLKSQPNKYKNTYFTNEMRLFDDWLKSL